MKTEQTLDLGLIPCWFKSSRLGLAKLDFDTVDGTVESVGNLLLSHEATLDG